MSLEIAPTPVRFGLPWEAGDRAPLTGHWWARGLNLAERLAATGAPAPVEAESDLTARAVKRLQRWREAYPSQPANALAAQLRRAGLTEPQMLALLAEDPASLAQRATKPAWADEVCQIVREMPAAPAPPAEGATWQDGLDTIVRPFVRAAVSRLEGSGAPRRARQVIDTGSLIHTFESRLSRELASIAAKALVLELNVHRVLGRLPGDDAAARFWSFVRLMASPDGFARFLDEYVVLARTMTTHANFAAEAQAEFCDRFTDDRPVIVERILGGDDPGMLTEISLGDGDAHSGGRAVAALRFASGDHVVYKPRPVSVHRHFNDIVHWYNGLSPDLSLRTLTVVDRGDYGWIEFAESGECADADGARRYFRRSGALLALLHTLGGTDFHHENVIAAGDQPLVIDLEALFHAEMPLVHGPFSAPVDPAGLAHRDSVSRIGLLPAVITGPNGDAIDLSGMGADGGHLAPFETTAWSGAGTDEMRLTRTRKVFPGSRNRPRLDGAPLDPSHYLSELRGGFRDGYRALLRHRDTLTAVDGPLRPVTDCGNRLVARPTQVYTQMLGESYHPDVTRDAMDREWIFGLLWAASAEDAQWERLVAHELVDLWNGDVPMFQGTVASHDLKTGGGAPLEGVLATSGWQRAMRIINRLSEDDLAEQEWIIEASMATRSPMRSREVVALSGWAPAEDLDGPLARRALDQAVRVGDILADAAYTDGGRVGWLGMELVAETSWTVSPLRHDLYGGLAGLALFFAQLAAVSAEQRFADIAQQTVGGVMAHMDVIMRPGYPGAEAACGSFGGLGGVVYALDSVAALLGDSRIAAPVAPMLDLMCALIGDDKNLDLIGGAAGCLAVAESITDRYGSPATRLAGLAAEVLVDQAVPSGSGVAWHTPMTASHPLLGMSHGASGIGMALLRHAARTGDGRAARTGYAAMAYERADYRADKENWPDYRVSPTLPWEEAPSDELSFMHAWCHGAPGIGLARAAVPAAMRTPEVMDDLRIAVHALARQPVVENHSLCHGALGNLELFAQASRLGMQEATLAYTRDAELIVAQVQRHGPRSGTPLSVRTPGLMAGLAGIGHGLLRIAEPLRIAPVLTLETQH